MSKTGEKGVALDLSDIESLNKKLGSKLKLSDDFVKNFKKDPIEKPIVSTGRPTIDFVTDGGFPTGGFVILAGQKSAGKSTLALQIADNYDSPIAYLDTEFTTTTSYIESLGIDSEKVFRYRAETIEQMSDILREIIPYFKVIIWDSVTNIASNEELSKSSGDRTRANSAIVLATQCKIWAPLLERHGSTLMCITHVSENQERMNKYDAKYIIPGGQRLHHNSSLTLMLNASTKVDEGTDEFGNKAFVGRNVRVVCEKNKSGAPLRSIKTKLVFKRGYTIVDDVYFSAKECGVITSGAWAKYGDIKLGQGQKNHIKFLEDNPELMEEIREKTLEVLFSNADDYNIASVDEAMDSVIEES